MKPNLVIVGAQKSASTFIHLCLREHPDVWMPASETPCFLSPDYENGAPQELYEVTEKQQEKIIGIKRPDYLYMPEVPERIAKELDKPKIIVVLREPLGRTKSAYFHYIRGGFTPLASLNKGVLNILNGKMKKKWKRSQEIIDFSRYSPGLERYFNVFPKDSILVLTHDEISRSPIECLQQIHTFLGIEKDFIPKSINESPQSVNYSLIRLFLSTTTNRFLWDYNQDRTRATPKERISRLANVYIKLTRKIDNRILSKYFSSRKKPDFSSKVKMELAKIFLPDIEKLGKLTGKDFSDWKNKFL
jgi:sulfotransferase family protein